MEHNSQLDLAWKFLENTGVNLFLTGKAGTGKTTFLRKLKEHSPKRMVVMAPTGVAALNAGGVTIHSFFQLPFGPYLPAMQEAEGGRLKMQFNREKINIIRSLDLLVIDEISMVRADLLDAVNDVLQRYRDRNKPFGGVQLLMIGDLQQLAPVVKQPEWEILRSHYRSPYFFDSKALRASEYLTLELQHIYRQQDREFIEILNRVRENTLDRATLNRLNSRYIPDFLPDESQGYITLTSHTDTARRINESKLNLLTTPAYTFDCEVEGEFPEYLYPVDRVLTLKEGAQVMFVKNDPSGAHRYFNGKIGRVTAIDDEQIEVTPDDSSEPIEVEVAEWTNAKYVIDPQTREITEQVEGKFRQYPLKAAWAITIHKSQGLTFDRAIIDAADSFSHGQVYVALSRCRSFEGLVLRTPLSSDAIISDSAVKSFVREAALNPPNEEVLSQQEMQYLCSLLTDMFDFAPLRPKIRWVQRVICENLATLYPRLSQQWAEILPLFDREILIVGEKFQKQLTHLLATASHSDSLLRERIVKGQAYFLDKCETILKSLVDQSRVEVDNKEVKKQLTHALKELHPLLTAKLAVLGLACEAGFSVHDYLETRAKAMLGEPKLKREKRGDKSDKAVDVETDRVTEAEPLDITNPELFERLRAWRKRKADENHVPVYIILHQKALISICNLQPRTRKELLAIKGVGRNFIAKYAEEMLAILAEQSDIEA